MMNGRVVNSERPGHTILEGKSRELPRILSSLNSLSIFVQFRILSASLGSCPRLTSPLLYMAGMDASPPYLHEYLYLMDGRVKMC